jgi:2'-5' RNA ligase
MARLFVAIDFPDKIKTALQQCQPQLQAGLRNTQRDQLHLTLHFLGESSVDAVVAALHSVPVDQFSLTIADVGRFETTDGGSILWAGLRPSVALTQLHQAISAALLPTGFNPETRPYSPHITLSRCAPGVPVDIIQTFLKAHAKLSLPPINVDQLSLYSSVLTPSGPEYKLETPDKMIDTK